MTKIASLLSSIACPVIDAPHETTSSIIRSEAAAEPSVQGIKTSAHESHGQSSLDSSTADVKAADSDLASPSQSADMAGMTSAQTLVSSQVLSSSDVAVKQLVSDAMEKINEDDEEAAAVGSTALQKDPPSPVGAVAASIVVHDSNTSGYAGQDFDEMVARAHEARVAAIEAALNNPNADLEATMQAVRARRIIRRAPVAAPAQVTGGQASNSGHSRQAATQPARDGELEWFRGEPPTSPQPDSAPVRSPRQSNRPH